MPKKKILKQSSNSLKSILIILSYFILPYLISFISDSYLFRCIFHILYFVILIFAYKNTLMKDIKNIKKDKKKSIKIIASGVLLIFVVTILVNAVIGLIFNIKQIPENDYSLMILFNESPLFLMLLTCIYYPIVEGIIFRKTVRDIIDKKWVFIIFSSLFYFLFNILYTSMSFNTIMASLCYFTTMMILSYSYFKTNNFTISVFMLMLYNFIFTILNFLL